MLNNENFPLFYRHFKNFSYKQYIIKIIKVQI